MGELLKGKVTEVIGRCRECGKLEGDDPDNFIHTFDEIIDLSDEEKCACEWFSENMGDNTFPDLTQMTDDCYTREELIHIFVLENLIEKLMGRKPICETCFQRKRGEKNLS